MRDLEKFSLVNEDESRAAALKLAAAGVTAHSQSGWLESMAQETATHRERRRSCILLWMQGGPSTIDTFGPNTPKETA